MAKIILVFCDGMGQACGLLPEQARPDVYKPYRATRPGPDSRIDPAEQFA